MAILTTTRHAASLHRRTRVGTTRHAASLHRQTWVGKQRGTPRPYIGKLGWGNNAARRVPTSANMGGGNAARRVPTSANMGGDNAARRVPTSANMGGETTRHAASLHRRMGGACYCPDVAGLYSEMPLLYLAKWARVLVRYAFILVRSLALRLSAG